MQFSIRNKQTKGVAETKECNEAEEDTFSLHSSDQESTDQNGLGLY